MTTTSETTGTAGTSEPMRGLVLSVLRPADIGDCTAGGITAAATRVTVLGVIDTAPPAGHRGQFAALLPPGSRVTPARPDAPPVAVYVRTRPFGPGGHLSLVPVDVDPETGRFRAVPQWTMFGGNYAVTSDGRWAELIDTLTGTREIRALPVHDRIER